MRGGGNSKLDREQDILKQVQDDINFPKNEPIHLLLHKFFAFTLAEVLITLGIIGIVAALTMPSLISNHKKKVYVNQLKKAVNTTTNGIRLILADSGVDNISDTPFYSLLSNALDNGDLSDLNTMAKRYFNLGQDISYVPSRSRDYAIISAGSHDSVRGNQPSEKSILFPTADGSEILIAKNSYQLIVFIDVNSYDRYPNKIGLDFFAFYIKDNGSVELGWPSYDEQLCLEGVAYASTLHIPAGCYSSVVANNWEITYY